MISIVGIGNAASAIAEKFKSQKNYEVYELNSTIKRKSKYRYPLKVHESPEEYEDNIPDVASFFANLSDRVQVFVVGASKSSSYTLGILEQLKDKKIDVFYIKPDVDMLSGLPFLLEKVAYGILQQYARSGLLNSFTIISNLEIERNIQNISIKNYYDSLNDTIFSSVHYLNFFTYSEPEIGVLPNRGEINRIRAIGMLDSEKLEEKWLFELDTPREICYYLCINEERLKTESGLHKHIVNMLKDKPRNAFRKISYGIYETHLNDFGFCVAHTNVIQQQKTLDKID